MPAALASSTARRAPFSLSLPRCAMPPVSGPTWPILTSIPAAAGAAAAFSAFGAGFCSPQPISATAAPNSAVLTILFITSSGMTALLLRKDPLHQRLDVGVGNVAVRRHGNRAPYARAALLHLVYQLRFRSLVGAVLCRDV